MKQNLFTLPTSAEQREPLSEGFFLNRNVIRICGEITDESANLTISSLLYLDQILKAERIPRAQREINIWINSPGGSVAAGLAIYDTMNFIDADIRTTCVGTAASMGAFLFSAGTRGKREILPHSTVMIHQPLGGTQGQATDIQLYTQHILSTRELLNRLLSLHTGKPMEQIRIDTERDNRMNAEEAVQYGLADRIILTPVKASITRTNQEVAYDT